MHLTVLCTPYTELYNGSVVVSFLLQYIVMTSAQPSLLSPARFRKLQNYLPGDQHYSTLLRLTCSMNEPCTSILLFQYLRRSTDVGRNLDRAVRQQQVSMRLPLMIEALKILAFEFAHLRCFCAAIWKRCETSPAACCVSCYEARGQSYVRVCSIMLFEVSCYAGKPAASGDPTSFLLVVAVSLTTRVSTAAAFV